MPRNRVTAECPVIAGSPDEFAVEESVVSVVNDAEIELQRFSGKLRRKMNFTPEYGFAVPVSPFRVVPCLPLPDERQIRKRP